MPDDEVETQPYEWGDDEGDVGGQGAPVVGEGFSECCLFVRQDAAFVQVAAVDGHADAVDDGGDQ